MTTPVKLIQHCLHQVDTPCYGRIILIIQVYPYDNELLGHLYKKEAKGKHELDFHRLIHHGKNLDVNSQALCKRRLRHTKLPEPPPKREETLPPCAKQAFQRRKDHAEVGPHSCRFTPMGELPPLQGPPKLEA